MGEAKRKRDAVQNNEAAKWARAAEPETGALLAGLITVMRPTLIAECGTYPGRMTHPLAKAAADVGATLDTVERVPWMYEEMRTEFKGHANVNVLAEPITDFAGYELTFLDSGPTYAERMQDLACWEMTAAPGAVAVLDDVKDGWIFPMLVQQNLFIDTGHGLLVVQRR